MSALSSKGNHFAVDPALLALPIDNCGLTKLASVKENVDRHSEGHLTDDDIHSAVPNCVVRHFIHKQRQPHTPSPRSTTTERLPRGTWPNDSVQTLNALTKVLFDQRFSPLADLAGALVPAPRAVATSPLVSRRPAPKPANDDWHPLEAA